MKVRLKENICTFGVIIAAASCFTGPLAKGGQNPEQLPEDVLDAMADSQSMLRLISPLTEAPVIVLGTKASEVERYAAQELSQHLQKITGQEIQVVAETKIPEGRKTIAVGKSKLTESYDVAALGIEQYIIDVKPDGVVIVGGGKPAIVDASGVSHARERGTLYGVYEFLENLGVRWYRPEPWGWHIPESKTVELKVGKTKSKIPDFMGRCAIRLDARWNGKDPELLKQTEDWSARQRLTIRSSENAKYGGTVSLGVSHAHARIISPGKYLKNHPDYFALVNGERGNPGSGKLPQLCLGNPELQEEFARNVIAMAKANPEAYCISVDPEDGTHLERRMCTCELCVAMDDPKDPTLMSNRVFAFTNIIAKKLAAEVPGAKVGLYAYSMHTKPPTLVEKLEPNVVVAAANINSWTDWSKKLFDPESAPNAQFVTLLKDWDKIATHPLWMREYSPYGWLGPIPMYHLLQDRVQSYRELGIEGFLWPGEPNWGPQLLLIYLKAQLQWNPDLDLQKELDLFYKNYYGPAAVPMKAYHERWMDAYEKSHLGSGLEGGVSSGGRGIHMLCTPKILQELGGYIAQAQELVKDQPLYQQRLQGTAAGYEFSRRIGEMLSLKLANGKAKASSRGGAASYLDSDEARQKWDDFTKWLLEANAENLTFEVKESNGRASATALLYMKRDVLENGRFSTFDERKVLSDSGFLTK